MIVQLIDQTWIVIRRLKLVEMAIEDVEDKEQAAALHEGVQITTEALATLKQIMDAAYKPGENTNPL